MSGIQLPVHGIWADITLREDWKTRQDAQARVIDAMLVGHWSIDYATTDEDTLTFGHHGGPIIDAAGVITAGGDGTVSLVDDDDNYIERTVAGVVSCNQNASFTLGALPMYKVTLAGGVITAIEDHRAFATQVQLTAALAAISALTPAADKIAYFTSGSAAALADLTAFARSLLDDANAGAVLTTLGVSAFAQTLLDDANAAAARTTLGLMTVMNYVGTWNATTNSPALADGAGNSDEDVGNVYRVTVAGSQDLGSGSIDFNVGDYVILNNAKIWEKSDTTDAVSSVNGAVGTVSLGHDDLDDVDATGKADGDLIAWDAGAGKYVPVAPNALVGIDAQKIQGVDVDDSNIGDGRSLVYRTSSGDLGYEDPAGGADAQQVLLIATAYGA